MAVFTVSLAALALVAAFPFAGSVAIGTFLAVFSSLTVVVASIIEPAFAQAAADYNRCRAAAGASTLWVFVITFAYIVLAASIVFLGIVWIPRGIVRR